MQTKIQALNGALTAMAPTGCGWCEAGNGHRHQPDCLRVRLDPDKFASR